MLFSLQASLVSLAGIFLSWLVAFSAGEQVSLDDTFFDAPQGTTANPTEWFAARSTADHQNDLNSLPANGWRLISLSVYGNPPNHLYTTVWVQRPGPLQQSSLALESKAFNNWWSFWTGQGYVPTITTATGATTVRPDGSEDFSGVVYAAVLEKINVLSWTAIWDRIKDDFDAETQKAFGRQQKMVSIDQYGRVTNPRFCALMHHNREFDHYVYFTREAPSIAGDTLRVQTTKPSWRPMCMSLSGIRVPVIGIRNVEVSSVYTDTYVGSWTAKIFQTQAQIAAEDVTQRSQGRQLVYLHGGISAFFNAIWAGQDSPRPREFRATGPPGTGFKNNPASLATVDSLLKSFMQDTGVREAQIAIGKNGSILLERAYTWSEPGRHIIQPSDKFQLASLSKMFCAATIQLLIDTGRLSLTTKPFNGDLGLGDPWVGPNADNRYRDITIDHLLSHQAGWNRDISTDWEFRMIQVSRFWELARPPSLSEFVTYLRLQVRLDFNPGEDPVYSNLGYVVLSQVVETVTGMAYFDYLKSAVLGSMGLGSLVEVFRTDASFHTNDAVTPQSSNYGPDVQTPQDENNLIASVFGGDGAFRETALGASFLRCSATTLVKFINKHCELPCMMEGDLT